MLLAFLLFFSHLRKLLYAADFSESHSCKNYGSKKCRIRNFLTRKKIALFVVFFVCLLVCGFLLVMGFFSL